MNAPAFTRHTKAHTFEFTTYILRTVGNMSNGAEREFEVEVTYTVTPGRPEQGPTYACGGQPAEPDEVEVLTSVLIGDSYPITTEEWDRIQDEAEQLAPDAMADEAAAHDDYRYEEYRERIAPGRAA